uniref:G2 and S phase-expressed protein 1 N-terminal domain-containing protein n=1 Tax=Laticauda laticaudata TaxID=8630 RepID=A0A8C5SZS4_LATLA
MEDRKTLDSECKTTDIPSNDFHLLTEEKFDFDLSLSPTSENEDEVFVGPVGHKEKCITVRLESHEDNQNIIQSRTYDLSWSPAADNFVEIFKEAHLLAFQLKNGNEREKNNSIHLREEKTEVVEKFVKESKSKLKIFEKGIVTDKRPTPTRRETYCVWESPSSQLLPSIQKCLRQPVTIMDGPRSPQVSLNTPSPVKTDKLSKMHSVSSPQTKNDTSLKKRSKFQAVKTSPALRNNSCLVAGETKQRKLPSFSSKIYSNSMGSSEDLLSDKSSVASDAGGLSFSTMQSKRTLPAPSKLEIKTRQLKPPNNVHMRRNTSSSSSSISSMNSSLNSSLSISPKRGSVKTNVAKAAADISRHSSVTSKISIVKPIKGFSVNAAHSDASGKQPTPKCAKGNPVNIPKYKVTQTSESASSNMQKGSDSSLPKVLSKNTLGNASTSSNLKLNSKTAAPNLKQENEVTRVLQSNPVLSSSNIESNVAFSTPVKQLERTVLKSCSAVKPFLRTPDRRHSTLPISVGRCILGIPTMSPQTVPRTMTSSNCLALRHVSSGSSKKTTGIRYVFCHFSSSLQLLFITMPLTYFRNFRKC